jgi:hypothetical protein
MSDGGPPLRRHLEAGNTTLFAGHSLSVSATSQPLSTFAVGESPLLARLRQFIPALKAANEQTVPSAIGDEVEVEEVVDGNDDDDGDEGVSSAGSASPVEGGERGLGGSLDACASSGAAAPALGVLMEVVMVPEDADDLAAKQMVDALADDGSKTDALVGGGGREEPLPEVDLEIETTADARPKAIHPGIRVMSSGTGRSNAGSGGSGSGGGGGGGGSGVSGSSSNSGSSTGPARDGTSGGGSSSAVFSASRDDATATSTDTIVSVVPAPQTRKAGAISAAATAGGSEEGVNMDLSPHKRARVVLRTEKL